MFRSHWSQGGLRFDFSGRTRLRAQEEGAKRGQEVKGPAAPVKN